ncbi:precorrin-8X methylmutase [Herbivorax sp. ANBcel31]|uniref:precorrin-8X methylmutase n=1 Tax=Herbivorax sp. ANBcel31 TaxID=3069754 RepID=UPI0027B3FCCB|nr:precorrin-8X methylmutase [Herbivorax sp. ANBcel31]MDQ2086942.1 precorrin-8X methylmutase [Herbivorax sp. ANBcel31]
MIDDIKIVAPGDIEKRSFEIISELIGNRELNSLQEPVIKRVIHTTADFEYLDTLKISENALEKGIESIKSGCSIVTDTKMAQAGINKRVLKNFDGKVVCYMDNEEIAATAKERNVTRASISMETAAKDENNRIFVVGNAPTALIKLYELIKEGSVRPSLVIGVPVGFVNVVESKELIKKAGVPFIISEGRKGGSNVAASIINAILYMVR